MNCPVCSKESRRWFKDSTVQADFVLCRCMSCDFAFVHPLPSRKIMDEFYSSIFMHPKGQSARAVRKWFEVIALSPKLKKKLGKKCRILEVGAGTGSVVSFVKSQGHLVVAQEHGLFAEKIRSQKIECIDTEFTKYIPKNKYDIIVLLDVIEHVPYPKKYLSHARACLKDDGLIVMTTPNFGSTRSKLLGRWWPWISPPGHLWYFNSDSMRIALQGAGFKNSWITSGNGDANSLFVDSLKSCQKMILVPVKFVLFFVFGRKKFMPNRRTSNSSEIESKEPEVFSDDYSGNVSSKKNLNKPTLIVVASR